MLYVTAIVGFLDATIIPTITGKYELINKQKGDEAGIKSVTFEIKGDIEFKDVSFSYIKNEQIDIIYIICFSASFANPTYQKFRLHKFLSLLLLNQMMPLDLILQTVHLKLVI